MRLMLWAIAVVLIILLFGGEKVRSYFKGGAAEVASESSPPVLKRGNGKPSADKSDSEKRSSSGSYVPSPADAPELYDSPTRRFGL